MIKLLTGGSPCTFWSIAQTRNREVEASGQGWELFKNFLIARDKFKPDYFLYENNKSMSGEIREQITRELGVEPIMINSALVSAQSRQRLYWTNIPEVKQPEDRGILLRDILESGFAWKEKAYCLGNADKPDRVGLIPRGNGKFEDGQRYRIYGINAKGGSVCARQINGLYAIPVNNYPGELIIEANGKTYPVYEVKNGMIAIKGNRYPVKLADGLYIIRKLTVRECMRLQTVPENYQFPVSDSQAYKMLGNGWTCDVISHILSYLPGIETEPLKVLSMYDGMSCAHIALDKLGADIRKYWATEIDPYAIKASEANFPDIIHLGDAFQVRDDDWRLPGYDLNFKFKNNRVDIPAQTQAYMPMS